MGRWEPDARGRLRAAALELYLERGFDQTTVADIAERAGLTARTFFRHYADKREVLFAGSAELEARIVTALRSAPPTASPMAAVGAALETTGELLTDRAFSRQRQAVINANADLRERELIKMASLSTALADGLRQRGVPDPSASLAAETGVAVFRVAFDRWIGEDADRSLVVVLRSMMAEWQALSGSA